MREKPEMKFEEGYAVSTDYEQLTELLKAKHKILCFADYGIYRDVSRAKFEHGMFAVGIRGIQYVGSNNEKSFKESCETYNLAWVIPSNI